MRTRTRDHSEINSCQHSNRFWRQGPPEDASSVGSRSARSWPTAGACAHAEWSRFSPKRYFSNRMCPAKYSGGSTSSFIWKQKMFQGEPFTPNPLNSEATRTALEGAKRAQQPPRSETDRALTAPKTLILFLNPPASWSPCGYARKGIRRSLARDNPPRPKVSG